MNINRDNYILWITSYYEGKLSGMERKMLLDFLQLNPDLEEEFHDFACLNLHPDISLRADRSFLYRKDTDISPEQAEQYAIALAEGDIEGADFEEITALLHAIEGGSELLNDYRRMKLVPEDISYPGKMRLKRIPRRRRIPLISTVIAAAATVALLFTVSTIRKGSSVPEYYLSGAPVTIFNSSEQASLSPVLSEIRPAIKPVTINRRETDETPITESSAMVSERVSPVQPVAFRNIGSLAANTPASTAILASMEFQPEPDPLLSEDLSPRQFIAMNFRKLLLKEEEATPERLKVHEVADVSIDGVNKLLGWNMQFDKQTDDEGRLQSFTFTSQLINFDSSKKKATDEL